MRVATKEQLDDATETGSAIVRVSTAEAKHKEISRENKKAGRDVMSSFHGIAPMVTFY